MAEKLASFEGGPQHGLVAEVSGREVCFILSTPRPPQLGENVPFTATWNEEAEWYEIPPLRRNGA